MINYIRQSVRYFDHMFEELEVRNWSHAVTLNSSKIYWNTVVTFAPASLKTDSVQSPFQLFQPLFSGELRVDVWELIMDSSKELGVVDSLQYGAVLLP